MAIPTWKTYPARFGSNTFVFKLACETSLLGTRFASILLEAGVPAVLFYMVVGRWSVRNVSRMSARRIRRVNAAAAVWPIE